MKNWLQNNISRIKDALFKTRGNGLLQQTVNNEALIEINDSFYDDLLEKFIRADIGIDLSEKIVEDLKKQIKEQKIEENDLKNKMKEVISSLVIASTAKQSHKQNMQSKIASSLPLLAMTREELNIFLITGVNGSGKTTSIGKLAKHFKEEGFKVLIVAADTFRAAAGEQLDIWAQRANVEIFSPKIGFKPTFTKPDAIVFSGIEKAKKENYNLLLIDTAGRLHSQINLMEELKKIDSVIEKNTQDSNKEKLIVLDATIGQNAIIQAELFSKAIGLTGIILAKLDSSSKGGVVLNIMNKLNLPVKLIGIGEKIDDLAEFDLDEYLDGLLSN